MNSDPLGDTLTIGNAPGGATGALAGLRIGPYVILREVGAGGFGVVYVAEQHEPVRRQVAIKIIKAGMDTRDVVARFEAERQALALMDHPHIARVIDAGATDTGRPFFVMDFVHGEPITAYCDRHHLSIDARLALFLQVCDAVQHAHGKAIIHRDLKPGNVLVAAQDGQPSAKVIDFGIAKATATPLTERTLYTGEHVMIGTPEYMSPEQAEGSVDIDTRTDVYALGVILYELLTGIPPLDLRSARQGGLVELQRQIRDVRPPRPSTRITQAGEQGDAIARSRGTDRRRLVERIGRGLDAIALKAIEKERSRRYDSVGALAADVRRFVAGEAVLAVPPTAAYLLGTFIRRHAIAVTAVAVVLLSLMAATGVSLWFARAARIRADAEAEARQRAESLNSFITSVLSTTNLQAEGKADTTVVQAMAQAIAEIDRGALAGDPASQASLFGTITDVMRGHGRLDEAATFAGREVALRRQHPGDGRDLVGALARQARMLRSVERDDEAMTAANEAVRLQQQVAPEDAYLEGQALLGLADAHMAAGAYPDAERVAVQAAAAFERTPERPSFREAAHQRIATSLRHQLRFDEAEAAFQRAVEIGIEEDPRPSLARGVTLHSLGLMQFERGEYAKALPALLESLTVKRQVFQGDHPESASTLGVLGATYLNLGRLPEAEAMHRDQVAMLERLKLSERDLLPSRALLANVWMEMRNFKEAETAFAAALEYRRRVGPPIELAFALSNVARARHGLGRSAEAWQLFAEAHGLTRSQLPATAAGHARVLFRSANARLEAGDVAEAVKQLEEAVATAQKAFAEGNARRVEYEQALAAARRRLAR